MRRLHLLPFTAGLLFPLLPVDAHAQVESCTAYDIVLEEQLVLGSPDDEGTVGSFEFMASAPDGRLFLRHFSGSPVVWVFDAEGEPMGSVGSVGEGPGEYQWPTDVVWGPGDSLHVFDFRQRRHLVYSSDLAHERTTRLPLAPHVKGTARLSATDWILNATVESRDLYGIPLHRIREGEGVSLVRSFGERGTPVRSDVSYGDHRIPAQATDSTVWAAHKRAYEIEEWTLTGEFLRSLTREVPEFRYWEESSFRPHPDNPPPPYVTDIRTDEQGLLWVLVAVTADEWQAGLERDTSGEWRPADRSKYYDTLIDVIDPVGQCLVASRRVKRYIRSFLDDGRVASYRQDELGVPYIGIFQVELSPVR